MALGILGAFGGLNQEEVPDCLFVGEWSLDGGVRGVRGALAVAIEARGKKISRMVVPELNAREAALVSRWRCPKPPNRGTLRGNPRI